MTGMSGAHSNLPEYVVSHPPSMSTEAITLAPNLLGYLISIQPGVQQAQVVPLVRQSKHPLTSYVVLTNSSAPAVPIVQGETVQPKGQSACSQGLNYTNVSIKMNDGSVRPPDKFPPLISQENFESNPVRLGLPLEGISTGDVNLDQSVLRPTQSTVVGTIPLPVSQGACWGSKSYPPSVVLSGQCGEIYISQSPVVFSMQSPLGHMRSLALTSSHPQNFLNGESGESTRIDTELCTDNSLVFEEDLMREEPVLVDAVTIEPVSPLLRVSSTITGDHSTSQKIGTMPSITKIQPIAPAVRKESDVVHVTLGSGLVPYLSGSSQNGIVSESIPVPEHRLAPRAMETSTDPVSSKITGDHSTSQKIGTMPSTTKIRPVAPAVRKESDVMHVTLGSGLVPYLSGSSQNGIVSESIPVAEHRLAPRAMETSTDPVSSTITGDQSTLQKIGTMPSITKIRPIAPAVRKESDVVHVTLGSGLVPYLSGSSQNGIVSESSPVPEHRLAPRAMETSTDASQSLGWTRKSRVAPLGSHVSETPCHNVARGKSGLANKLKGTDDDLGSNNPMRRIFPETSTRGKGSRQEEAHVWTSTRVIREIPLGTNEPTCPLSDFGTFKSEPANASEDPFPDLGDITLEPATDGFWEDIIAELDATNKLAQTPMRPVTDTFSQNVVDDITIEPASPLPGEVLERKIGSFRTAIGQDIPIKTEHPINVDIKPYSYDPLSLSEVSVRNRSSDERELSSANRNQGEAISCSETTKVNLYSTHDNPRKSNTSRVDYRQLNNPVSQSKDDKRSNLKDKPYKCSTCGQEFVCLANLKGHKRRQHVQNPKQRVKHKVRRQKPWKCSACGKCFAQSNYLQKHRKIHMDKQCKCAKCDEEFACSEKLEHHKLRHKEISWRCSACGKCFPQSRLLEEHYEIHTDGQFRRSTLHEKCVHSAQDKFQYKEKPWKCSTCGKLFAKKNHWRRHEKVHSYSNNQKNKYKCETCSQKFSCPAKLEQHRRKHTGEKPCKCSTCGKCFARNDVLKKHEEIHANERRFRCSTCSKKFLYSYELKRHERTHSGEKLFECHLCGKKLTQKTGLQRHIESHLGHKPFSCSLCGKNYVRKSVLSKHMRSHVKIKPCCCLVCGKAFRVEKKLDVHYLTHTKKSPNRCPICKKNFITSEQVIWHLRNHSLKHKCTECGEVFRLPWQLNSHMMRSHGNRTLKQRGMK